MRGLIAMSLLAQPIAVEHDDRAFCVLVERVAVAADEPVPFASLAGADLFGLLAAPCRIARPAPRTLACRRAPAPPGREAASLTLRLQRGLPGAIDVTPADAETARLLRRGRLVAEVDERTADREQSARIVAVRIAASAD